MTPPDDIRVRPKCLRDDAIDVLDGLRRAGHVAYFAGGCVRDLLLKREPKDYDIATDAPPARVRELFSRTQAVGAAFGVVLVRQRSSVIEVATFRTDGHYADGRHPESVRFATAEEDANRRDFTINGLFLDPDGDRVVDYVGGQADLENRLLRAIGDPVTRFAEDHLRLLRAVRFAARFDLTIDPETAAAITSEAPKLKRITPERIADELRLMLPPPSRFSAWVLLGRFGLLSEIFRQVAPVAPAPNRSLFLSLAPGMAVPFPLALLAAASDVQGGEVLNHFSPPAVSRTIRALRQSLKISNAESDAIEEMARGVMMLLGNAPPTLARRKRFLAMPTAMQSIDLMRAIAATGELTSRIASEIAALHPLIGTEVAPKPLITGDDLKQLGLSAGPAFKRILDSVYDAQLEGTIGDVDSARALAMNLGENFRD